MHTQTTAPAAWPSVAELESVLACVAAAANALDRLAVKAFHLGDEPEVSHEKLGALTAAVSILEADVAGMERHVEKLARLRDAVPFAQA